MSPETPLKAPATIRRYRSRKHAAAMSGLYALGTGVTLGNAYILAWRGQLVFSYKVALLFLLLVLASNLAAKACVSYAHTFDKRNTYGR